MKKGTLEFIVYIIILVFAVIWLVNVAIPYLQADYQSKQAIIEMSKNGGKDD